MLPRRSLWTRLRIWRWLLALVLATCGYGAWREYAFGQAIKEAKALGWYWVYDEPFDAIRKDWKAAFRKATWTDGKRNLTIPQDAGRKEHEHILRRLSPNALNAHYRPGLRDLSALKGLTALQRLYLHGCTEITNVDALAGLPALQELHLGGCAGLTNVDGIKGLTALQFLNLSTCTELTNLDGLKGVPALQQLDLSFCTGLTNVDALKGLPALQGLNLRGCTGLANVDGLKDLPALQFLDLNGCAGLTDVDGLKRLPALQRLVLLGCTGIPAEQLATLWQALPKTAIYYP